MKYLDLENASEARKATFSVGLIRTTAALVGPISLGFLVWAVMGAHASWDDVGAKEAFVILTVLIVMGAMLVGTTIYLIRLAARMERQEAELADLAGGPLEQRLERERRGAEVLRKSRFTVITAFLIFVYLVAFDAAIGKGIDWFSLAVAMLIPASYFWMLCWTHQRRRTLESISERTRPAPGLSSEVGHLSAEAAVSSGTPKTAKDTDNRVERK